MSQAQDCPPAPLVTFQGLLLLAGQLHYLSQMLHCIQGWLASSDAGSAGVCAAADGVRSPAAVVTGSYRCLGHPMWGLGT